MSSFHSRLWIGGRWIQAETSFELRSPYTGEIVGRADLASSESLELALQSGKNAFDEFKKSSRYIRSRLLSVMAKGIEARREDFVNRIVEESGKPYTLADIEVSRAIGTFNIASEEAKRFGGEVIPVDTDAGGRSFLPAVVLWKPRGPVLGISPFNFPLNLVAHKVAPALAVGTSVLLKPPPQAPGAAVLLAEVFEKAVSEVSDAAENISLSAFQVIHASNELMAKVLADERISILSFTGSHKVGWMLRNKAEKKKVLLELGGNAAVIIDEGADLLRAAQRCAFGGYAYAGQICISVQRIFVQKSVASEFQDLLLKEIKKLPVGDPSKKETVVGPLIDSENVNRVQAWVDEAIKDGAKVLCSGVRDKNILPPILLTNVNSRSKISCDEVFGPVVVLEAYEKLEEVVAKVNSSIFGLQAGVFSQTQRTIQYASENLEVGGVLINEIPTYRADHLPYGGLKDSGLGREGLRYAMQEYSEQKTIIQWRG